jgi:hypothetical protein
MVEAGDRFNTPGHHGNPEDRQSEVRPLLGADMSRMTCQSG